MRLAPAPARSRSQHQRTPPVTLAPQLGKHNHCLESAENILVKAEKDLAGLRKAFGLYATRPGPAGAARGSVSSAERGPPTRRFRLWFRASAASRSSSCLSNCALSRRRFYEVTSSSTLRCLR